MLKTLHGKLTLVLIALLIPIAALYLLLSTFTTRSYNQEVRQKLGATLAQNLIAENDLLMQTGQVNQAALSNVLKTMMVINPQIELYVLNPQGEVVASSEPGDLARRRVALEPIHAFLHGGAFPIYGDDPRAAGARRVFSVAPIADKAGTLEGYLYIVLTSGAAASAAQMLQGSYIFRLSVWLVLGGLVFILLAGVLLFNLLTRRLRRLVRVMDDFKKSDFQAAVPAEIARPRGDDIDQLGVVFSEMAGRIQKQLGDLTQADALRRELIANVSHDLRTPLAALQGYLETLLIKEGRLTAGEERRYLNIALQHGERLSKLIGELFELAKLDAGAAEPRLEPFSLAELAQDVVQKFQLAATEKDVELRLQAESNDLPFVQADLGLIERVLSNLLDNALRHTPAGGTVTVALRLEAGVTVEVRDTGAGIPATDLPHIFERYYHASRTPSEKSGTGLGLAISQRVLELHGSHIEVTSREGVGSSFTFTLPTQAALRDTSAMT